MGEIAAKDRLIVALDYPGREEALGLVGQLGGTVSFFKVGYELFIAEGLPLVRELHGMGHQVFLDLKMDDVPETVSRAVSRVAREPGIAFLTIHGGRATAEAAVKGRGGGSLKLLQITVLTSMGDDDLGELGLAGQGKQFENRLDYALHRAGEAVKNGCDGVIGSGAEAADLRARIGEGPLIVCPGIRPAGAATEDHKAPSTPSGAIGNGADYLVVGRPIRNAEDPAAAATEIIRDIEKGLQTRS